jgi:RNase H-fold protein (predicted Holliday junction resolvase)
MPSNSSEYQRQYRAKHRKTRKEVSVSLPISLHKEFSSFAKRQNMSLARLMRESTDLQIRGNTLKSRAVEEELKELRFLISNIANNVNQMARHSNQIKQVTDENEVFQKLHELEQLVTNFTNNRLKQPL